MSFNWSCLPTISTSGKTVSVTSNSWDYDSKFVTKTNEDGHVELRNIDSNKLGPASITYKGQEVKNVYSGTGINPLYTAVNKTGSQCLVQLRNSYIDTAFGTNADTKVLPFEGHFVIRVPNDPAVTDQVVADFVNQCVAAMATSEGSIKNQLSAMVRGALNPRS